MHTIHRSPHAGLDMRTDRPELLLPGDIVIVLFEHAFDLENMRGTIRCALNNDRYCVVITDEAGEDRLYSVPRDLLVLVRRADA